MKPKLYYSREEMQELNTQKLKERGVTVEEIALIPRRHIHFLSKPHIFEFPLKFYLTSLYL